MATTIKHLFFALTLSFCHFSSYGQQTKIDSLKNVLKTTKEDTTRINILNDLAFEFENNNSDTAIVLSTQALLIAQKKKWQKGEGISFHRLGALNYHKANYPLALDYYFKALKIRESLNDKNGISGTIGNIGLVYYSQGEYSQALDYYFKALKMMEKIGDIKGIAVVLGNIGLVYFKRGDYPKALDHYFRALKMTKKMGEKNGTANHLGKIGVVYKAQGDYLKALDYYSKALKMEEELGNKNGIARHLGNIGVAYHEQGNYPKALDYYFKALKIDEELGNKSGIARHLGSIGVAYYQQGNHPKAFDYFFKVLKMAKELGNKSLQANTLGNIGESYIRSKRFKQAEKFLQKALALSTEINELDLIKVHQNNLSNLYTQTNQPTKAFEHYKKYIEARDSIFNEENTKKIVRSEMNFDFEKKEAVANAEHKSEMEKQNAIAEEKSKKQKIIIFSIIAGLLLVIVFSGFIFRSLRITRKQKQIIEIKNKETEEQKQIIEEKNKDITDSITYAKRIQRAMLPHRRDIWAALPNSFVLFKPKDIVSGDFYFFHKNNNSVFIASADCTGHGVPGAFMSMIGSERLTDAVQESSNTSEILSLLNKGIKTSLKQSENENSTRDGMDIALCSVDTDKRVVKYAGANRPIWIIRNGLNEVEEIKATKKAIGGFTEDDQHFDTHEIKLQQGDTFYISTDGYADTFGGQEKKKLMTKRFKEILLEIQYKPMKEQGQHLDNVIENWKAGTEQVDDILVIGIRL
ncbi:MAG: tetratricopeptide repeat protein [Bacteroidetes bacterium]|nr:tetratricopeptide repeat protein [Bacteroidota bacterium]